MANGKFISYLRVSTARQGASGLGLEAQRDAVTRYLNGGHWQLVQELVEVESGKRNDRPQIAEALRLCRLHKATLVIAKLDRLARNVHFISSLMESGVDFVACDFPEANRLTVHILAAVAEHEAGMISGRTKAALSAARARGVALGGQRGPIERMRAYGGQGNTSERNIASRIGCQTPGRPASRHTAGSGEGCDVAACHCRWAEWSRADDCTWRPMDSHSSNASGWRGPHSATRAERARQCLSVSLKVLAI